MKLILLLLQKIDKINITSVDLNEVCDEKLDLGSAEIILYFLLSDYPLFDGGFN